jgi:hypothetical protein
VLSHYLRALINQCPQGTPTVSSEASDVVESSRKSGNRVTGVAKVGDGKVSFSARLAGNSFLHDSTICQTRAGSFGFLKRTSGPYGSSTPLSETSSATAPATPAEDAGSA